MKSLLLILQKFLSIILCLFVFSFFACSAEKVAKVANNEGFVNEIDSTIEVEPVLPSLDMPPNIAGKYIAVLFGYGYNEGVIKENLLAALEQEYGFVKNGGIIIPLIYPDDFISFGYERISLLPELIEAQLLEHMGDAVDSPLSALTTLITVGAPDGTHIALATLQDAEIQNTAMQLAVFSLFSQDDVLGTEAGSDLVIDYSPAQIEGTTAFDTTEEVNISYPNDVFEIIAPLINASLDWQQIEKNGLLVPALRTEFLKRTACNLFVYVDPLTSLHSENHYVLQNTAKELQ